MKESRDFQLLPRLDDLLFLGEHFDISTILELNNPKKCKNTYLKYLAEKVGFYTDKYIPDKVLINIISAFKTAIKNKGTQLGVEQAVNAIFKAENSVESTKIVHVKGFNETNNYYEQYTINIYTPIKIINEIALREFLKYIIPAGYNYNIYVYEDAGLENEIININSVEAVGILKTNINESATLGTLRTSLKYNGANNIINNSNLDIITTTNVIKGYEKDSQGNEDKTKPIYNETNLVDRLIGSYDMGVVVDSSIIKKDGTINYNSISQTVINNNNK